MIRLALALAVPLLVLATAPQAQQRTSAHMEGCLVWNRPQGPVMVGNECSRSIAFRFLDLDTQKTATLEIAPGQRFTLDAQWGQPAGFMFTACPVGFRPSVEFTAENQHTIAASLYNCVIGDPTS